MSDHNTHLTAAQIMAAADGELGASGVGEHLATCAECIAAVREWQETVAELAVLRAIEDDEVSGECPPIEELANYCAGAHDSPETLLEHIAKCPHCATVVREVTTAGEEPPAIPAGGITTVLQRDRIVALASKPRYRWIYALAAGIVLTAGLGAWLSMRRASDPERLLAQAYTAARPFEFRLPDQGYASIKQQRGQGGSAFDRDGSLAAAEVEIRKRLSQTPADPKVLEEKGRLELLERDYKDAIDSLIRAQDANPDDPEIIAALATAYAARGDAEGTKMDLGHALDLYLKASRIQSKNERLLFNLALVYEKLSMVDQALTTWHSLLELNPSRGWRDEANSHVQNLEKIRTQKKAAENRILHDPARFLVARLQSPAFDPLEYYEIFWTEWLPGSDESTTLHDAAAAVAGAMGERTKDWSLRETLAGMKRQGAAGAITLLARSIRENREGHAALALRSAREAINALDAVGLGAAAQRARVELAYASRWAADYKECTALTERVVRDSPAESRWLVSSAHLEHSSCATALGQSDRARAEIERTYADLSNAGIWPVALRALGFLTGLDGYTGDYGPIWENALLGLHTYWTTSSSIYRAQNFQFDLQTAANLAGWRDAAAAFYGAAVDSAHAAGNYEMEVWDRFDLAGLLQESGDSRASKRELQQADRLLHALEQSQSAGNGVLENLHAESHLRAAEAHVAANEPKEAIHELATIEEKTEQQDIAERMRVAQVRALALSATSEFPQAVRAFDDAIALNQKRVLATPSWSGRLPALETAAPSYRWLTQIQIQQDHDPTAALCTWNKYRGGSGPPAGLTITMAVLPRGLAIWRSGSGDTTGRWVGAPTVQVQRTVEAFRRLCTSPVSDEGEIRRLGTQLFRWLLGPELRGAKPGIIRVNADSWLATLPLGALTEPTGEYALRKWSFAKVSGPAPGFASLRDGQRIGGEDRVLVVTAPSGTAPGHASLPFLAAATQEASAVAGHFRSPVFLTSTTLGRLWEEEPHATVFHFVGHGWANGGGGGLVLGAANDGESMFLSARDLGKHDWSRCRLAVLSACLTASGAERGPVNNQSLVSALLSAGARRVVASLWSVDSDATRVLMVGFYARLFAGVPIPDALAGSAAEISDRGLWKHPYYWAGFEVFEAAR